jgi:Tfp pilus assembly protein PilX
MRRKKGYALILVIVVILLLMVLSTIVLSLSTTAFISTKKIEQNNKLKLAAEAGIDRGKLILRNYVLKHSDVFINPALLDPDLLNTDPNQFKSTADNIDVYIKFLPATATLMKTFDDTTTGRVVDKIEIQATAKDAKGTEKVVNTILDKNGVTNIYFDRLFHGSFTALGDLSTDIGFDSKNIDLKTSGSAFLQGQTVKLSPTNLTIGSGEIKVRSETFTTNIETITNCNLYKQDGLSPKTGWKDITIPSMEMLDVMYHDPVDHPNAAVSQNLVTDTIDNIGAFIELKYPVTVIGGFPKLVTYKAEKKGPGALPVDFRELIDGRGYAGNVSGLYKAITDQLKIELITQHIATPGYIPTNDELLQAYGTFYKLIVIDGDLNINDNTSENFSNYIIYCTGTVTFLGEASFYNCSIFSKHILFTDATPSKSVVFHGVDTPEAKLHRVGISNLSDFSSEDKGIINKYLIDNLKDYGDYLKYKTLKWKE